MLRAVARYLRQVGIPFSDRYMERTMLGSHRRGGARSCRSSTPASTRPATVRGPTPCAAEIEAAIDAVDSLDEDRILRGFLSVVRAMLRTNYFQPTGNPYRLVQARPDQVPLTCRCRAQFEICVHSPRVEGVHLRGGPVARGGLRWSDRREDFRTEVLGLVKAQTVKNAGHRAGRRQGRLRGARSRRGDTEGSRATRRSSARCSTSRTTDAAGAVVRRRRRAPRRRRPVPRRRGGQRDGDVLRHRQRRRRATTASGWATRSRPAARVGYDHKAMGITARRRMGISAAPFPRDGVDVQREDFTVAGIGDMCGDVFGNGMLLSEHVRLVAAFDHRHVFLDPAPDAASRSPSASGCSTCRARPGPTTTRADRRGGGVFRGTAKSVAAIGAGALVRSTSTVEALRPAELIRRSCARRSTCCGTAASARTSRLDPRRTPTSATRPTTRVRVNATSWAPGRRRGRRPRLHAARPTSSPRSAAAMSTPTRSTTRPHRLLRPRGRRRGPARHGRGRAAT